MLRRVAGLAASRLQGSVSEGYIGGLGKQGICSTSYASAAADLEVPLYNLSHEEASHCSLYPCVIEPLLWCSSRDADQQV